MTSFTKLIPVLGTTLVGVMATQPSEAADAGKALKEAWACAKTTIKAHVDVGADLLKKGEAVASLSTTAGKCLATSGADQTGFGITMGALTAIKIASPSSLPNGQCLSSVKKSVAKPFGAGLAAVLPSGSATDKLKALLESETAIDALWQQMTAIPPPVMTATSHVECACEFIDKGVSLADLGAVSKAVSQVSDTCAGFLDAAGLGFINDFGSAAVGYVGDTYKAIGSTLEDWQNIPEPAPDSQVYHGFWGAFVPEMAGVAVMNPGANLGTAKWHNATGSWISLGTSCYQTNCMLDMPKMYEECVHYYRTHRFSDSHAHEKCGEYRQRASDAAVVLAKQFKAVMDVRKQLPDAINNRVESHWVWRLPYKTSVSPYSKLDNNWSRSDAMQWAYADVIGQATDSKYGKAWQYQATGLYAAARDLLPNVGYDAGRAIALAINAVDAGFDRATRMKWESDMATPREYWMKRWFPPQPMTGPYGCEGSGYLSNQCQKSLRDAFDKVCLPAVMSAHVDTANVLVAGARVKKAEDNCHSWFDPMLKKFNAVMAYDISPHLGTVCSSYSPRTPEAEKCQRMVQDAFSECAADAMKNNQAVSTVQSCMKSAETGIRQRMNLGRRIEATPTPNTPTTPKLNGIPVTVPTAPTNDSAPVTPVGRPAPTTAPTAPITLPVPAGRTSSPANTPSSCPEGETPITNRKGETRCVKPRQN